MNWETFYFVCFVAGLFLSGFSLLGGMGHLGGHIHLPHGTHVPHMPHMTGAGHGTHMPHAAHAGSGATRGNSGGPQSTVPWWNAFSIMVFITWIGATG